MRKMATDSPKYQAVHERFDRLVDAIKSQLVQVADKALAKNLISNDNKSEAVNETHGERNRASKLLSQILDKIGGNDSHFDTFVAILGEVRVLKGIADELTRAVYGDVTTSLDSESLGLETLVVGSAKETFPISPTCSTASLGETTASKSDTTSPSVDGQASDTQSPSTSGTNSSREDPRPAAFQCRCGNDCSFDAYMRGECPGPLEDLFRYLNTDGLSPRDKDKLIRKLLRETRKVVDVFQCLVADVFDSLHELKVPMDKLRAIALNFGQLDVPKDQLFSVTSVYDVQSLLVGKNYISFFNYKILEEIINRLLTGRRDIEKRFKEYLQTYKHFCRRNVFEVPSSVIDKCAPDHETTLVVKVNEEQWFNANGKPSQSNFAFKEIYMVEDKLADVLDLESSSYVLLRNVKKGCVELSFVILTEAAVFPLAPSQLEELAKFGIAIIGYAENIEIHSSLPDVCPDNVPDQAGITHKPDSTTPIESDVQPSQYLYCDRYAELRDLHKELEGVIAWFSLGIQLKIPSQDLLAIRMDNYDQTERCRLEMLMRWVQLETPTWSKLVSALANIGRKGLAKHLAEKYGVPLPVVFEWKGESEDWQSKQERLRQALVVKEEEISRLLDMIAEQEKERNGMRKELDSCYISEKLPAEQSIPHTDPQEEKGSPEECSDPMVSAEEQRDDDSTVSTLAFLQLTGKMSLVEWNGESQTIESILELLSQTTQEKQLLQEQNEALRNELSQTSMLLKKQRLLGPSPSTGETISTIPGSSDSGFETISSLTIPKSSGADSRLETLTVSSSNREDLLDRFLEDLDSTASEPPKDWEQYAELADLQRELMGVIEWFALGVQLKIPTHDLLAIRIDHRGQISRCRLEMLVRWGQLETPTWSKLVSALANIGQKGLAEHLADKYGVPHPFESSLEQDAPYGERQKLPSEAEELLLAMSTLEKQQGYERLEAKVKSLIKETKFLRKLLKRRDEELKMHGVLKPSVNEEQLQVLDRMVKEKSDQIRCLEDELNSKYIDLQAYREMLWQREKEITRLIDELDTKSTQVLQLEYKVEKLKQSFTEQEEVLEMNRKLIGAASVSQEKYLEELQIQRDCAVEEASKKKEEIQHYNQQLVVKEEENSQLSEKIFHQEQELLRLREELDSRHVSKQTH